MPTEELIDAVQDVVNAKKPICSDADVKAPDPVVVDATIAIKVIPGTPNQAGIATEAANIINGLFIRDDTYSLEDLRFKIGHDVTQDRSSWPRAIPGRNQAGRLVHEDRRRDLGTRPEGYDHHRGDGGGGVTFIQYF